VPTAFQGSKRVRGELKRRKYQVKARYQIRANTLLLGFYKIYVFYFNAFLWEPTILYDPPPTTWGKLLYEYCAIYDPPPTPVCVCAYTIQYRLWQYRVKAKFLRGEHVFKYLCGAAT